IANQGVGPWQTGWSLVDAGPSDRAGPFTVEKYGIRWQIHPALFRPSNPANQLRHGSVKTGKEFRDLLPGFYMALGNADDDPQAPTLRFYWNVSADGAVPLLSRVTSLLNEAVVPFRLK